MQDVSTVGQPYLLTKLWERRGAPCGIEGDVEKDDFYWMICSAWHIEKRCLIRYVGFLELWAEQERQWEEEHPDALKEVEGHVESVSKALAIARRNISYLIWFMLDAKTKLKEPANTEAKKVRFQEDITERPTRKPEAFRRRSERYVHGEWAPDADKKWLNTSFCYKIRYGTLEFEVAMDEMWEGKTPMAMLSEHYAAQ
jgi:hypothetical protein